MIKREAVICPECGVSQEQSSSSDGDPGVAALLSAVGFIFPIAAGAGQIYNGQIGKGILFSLVQFVNFFLVFLFIGFITYPLVGIWTIYDAYQNAQ
ncbi:hypothetical protein B1756_08910 [Natrarchaeobaculum aegyptiacum]|uniref:TM2 domain-containing protein n=1 Tax=Natrarchaeobaculum aegyptiacum TaxID=745377 RepID=A0A2Z2HX17_9EURY|nr:hypothetical protein B1756_08910 [Natrarchaeobaculum aegyptiacum]